MLNADHSMEMAICLMRSFSPDSGSDRCYPHIDPGFGSNSGSDPD